MCKINNKTNKITLTKGDNAELTVKIIDSNGVQRGIYDDDVIALTVRKTADSEEVALSKTAVDGKITFTPEDTNSLSVGLYCYDIQLTTFGGKIYTVVPLSVFEISQEVTR